MGVRELSPDRRILNGVLANGVVADTVQLRTREPRAALAELYALDRRHVFLEGGPTLAAAFVRAGLVDEVVVYVAPMLLGAGASAVGDLGIATIADALHLQITDVTTLGTGPETNVRITLNPEGDR
jgi:diaminohydroxyphosphoribosylaminopyrimidine deaminase / 5-amino-6-(5-phosphoribosylamino)uracil reductase